MDATKPPLAGRTVSRPHYKALYLTAVALHEKTRDDLDEIRRNRDTWKEAYDYALSEATSYRRDFMGMAAVAIVESLALIALMLR